MKSPRISLFLLGFAGLLTVFGYLYFQTQAIDTDRRNELVQTLRELRQLDAEWNADIMKLRIGLHSNYDPVTTLLPAARALRERLIHLLTAVDGAQLEASRQAMEKAFVDKEDLVEQFKSQNAVLRNSLRYFPAAVEEFQALMRERRNASGRQALGQVETDIDRLLTDILIFNQIPEKDLGDRIAAMLEGIERARDGMPGEIQEPHALLSRHAHIILRQRTIEDTLIARIAGAPTAEQIDALNDAVDEAFRKMLHERQRYRFYLFVYSGFLLALLTYAAWRLIHSYKVIASINRGLQAANETLEQRVTERTAELSRQSAQLEELATHDALTGLINRRHLMLQTEQAMMHAERRGWMIAVMFIDLDGFKAINDTYGHATGDRALQEVALRLRPHVRKEDALARLGGDEFVILMNDISSPRGASRLAEAVLDELHGMRELDGQPICLSASIGIATANPRTGIMPAPDVLLTRADQAMYRAKQQGKGCYRFSEEGPRQTETFIDPPAT